MNISNKYVNFIKQTIHIAAKRIKDSESYKESVKFGNYFDLPQIVHEKAECCFVLSTGRCGTELLTYLLELSNRVRCDHTPTPELIYFSKLAYNNYQSGNIDGKKFEFALDAARYEIIQDTFIKNKIYVETNNRITFFAPYIEKIFHKPKFIHLVRHPGDYTRSGMLRKWYSGENSHDHGRIIPLDGLETWEGMTQIEKISWLWNETNQFIEEFKKDIRDKERIFFVKAEDLFSEVELTKRIFKFLHLEAPPDRKIAKIIKHPVNIQRKGNFPRYENWTQEQKDQLRKFAALSSSYGYEL